MVLKPIFCCKNCLRVISAVRGNPKDKIEKLQKRALQIIEDDFTAMYENLLAVDESIMIHKRNLQFLMTEIYKTLNDMNPPFMKEIFVRPDTSYNLKS